VRVPGGFEEFWKAWPWKRNRKKAEVAFRNLNPDRTLLDRILAWIPGYGDSDSVKRGAILHASTVLNGRRWEDELSPDCKEPDYTEFLRGDKT